MDTHQINYISRIVKVLNKYLQAGMLFWLFWFLLVLVIWLVISHFDTYRRTTAYRHIEFIRRGSVIRRRSLRCPANH